MPAPDKLAYQIKEAADAIGIGRTKLYELIGHGEVRTFKIGHRTLIRRQELEALIERMSGQRAA